MKEDISNWIKQAKYDLGTAKVLLDSERLDASTFYCQQALEKYLKAYIMFKEKESAGNVHSLLKLARMAKVPKKFDLFLKGMTVEYFISRYPDASEQIPYTLYDVNEVKENLRKTREVISWLETQMKK